MPDAQPRRDFSLAPLVFLGVVAAWVAYVSLILVDGVPTSGWPALLGVVLILVSVFALFVTNEKARWRMLDRRRVIRRRRSRGAPDAPKEAGANVTAGHRRASVRAIGGGLIAVAMLGLAVYAVIVFGRMASLPLGYTAFLCAVAVLAVVVMRELARWRRMEKERAEGRKRARGIVRWARSSPRDGRPKEEAACVSTRPRRRVTEQGQWKGVVAMVLVVVGCLATVLAVMLSFATR